MVESFKIIDDVLRQGVQGIANVITVHAMINLDLDVKTIMQDAGTALMGIGTGTGENRRPTRPSGNLSPLLEVSIDGARGFCLPLPAVGYGLKRSQ